MSKLSNASKTASMVFGGKVQEFNRFIFHEADVPKRRTFVVYQKDDLVLVGIAQVGTGDQFCRAIGRNIAESRVLHGSQGKIKDPRKFFSTTLNELNTTNKANLYSRPFVAQAILDFIVAGFIFIPKTKKSNLAKTSPTLGFAKFGSIMQF